MNRILIGSGKNKLEKAKGDELVVNVDKDTNILINSNNFKKCIIDVDDSNLNALIIRENDINQSYEINIRGGIVVLNLVSYSSLGLDVKINLNKENSKVFVYNSVIANKKEIYNIRVNHNALKTDSNIYNNGITKDLGTIVFNVTSYVPKKSISSSVNQDSKIITLNEVNDNEINPVLLIDEYDSEARHAAFIGNFNKTQLFYLMSRGLSKKEASNLLINGLLIGTLDVCFNEKENLKKKLNDEWR